jgi:hypothetical protein
LQLLWSDGRESWVKETNLPSAVLEVLEKKGSYEVKTRSVEEFGQKRSLLEVASEGKIGKQAKIMERLVFAGFQQKYIIILNI